MRIEWNSVIKPGARSSNGTSLILPVMLYVNTAGDTRRVLFVKRAPGDIDMIINA